MNRGNWRKTIILLAFALLFALYGAGCSTRSGSTVPGSPEPSGTEDSVSAPPVTSPPAPEDTPVPEATPEATPEPTPEPTPQPPSYDGPDLEEREPVSDDFFADAAFFGNSLVNGLELFGGLEYGDFHALTSASVVSVSSTKNAHRSDGSAATLLQALTEKQYGKIYILLGINEIGFDVGYFKEIYADMLDQILAAEPEADIYIMSLTPVTQAKSSAGAPFTMERIGLYNEALYELAREYELYYVDLIDALSDASGYLAADMSTDGVHLQAGKYRDWADYLRTHYADTENTRAWQETQTFVEFEAPEESGGA